MKKKICSDFLAYSLACLVILFNGKDLILAITSIKITRQVYNLFQEHVEQPPLGFSIAEEKIDSFKNQTG